MRYLSIPGQDADYLFAPANSGGSSAYVLAFNMDMIQKAGLENPQDLYDRNEWTWDKWREYLKVLTKDVNNDGTTDIYGYSGWWTQLLSNLLFSNSAGIARSAKEELSSAATREVLQFIYDIYNTDKTARPWDNSNWNINNSLYADGLAAFWIGADWIFNEYGGENLPFKIGVVPWPVGPHGNSETNSHSQPQGNWYFIPKGVENPRLVYDVLFDWINWYNDDISIGMDNAWSKQMYMSERNFNYAAMMSSKPGFDIFDSLGTGFALSALITGEVKPDKVVVDYSQQFQDALDTIFK
jgi:ABC-type glycerol-3-phosphate transport system substrate-binding protein